MKLFECDWLDDLAQFRICVRIFVGGAVYNEMGISFYFKKQIFKKFESGPYKFENNVKQYV